MSKVDEIMELLEGLTLLDASDLVTKIEDKFGVDASASGGGMMMRNQNAGGANMQQQARLGPGRPGTGGGEMMNMN